LSVRIVEVTAKSLREDAEKWARIAKERNLKFEAAE
jgi:hypothetical protein